MRTLGIDLASQDRDTAACAIDWGGGRARIEDVVVGLSDVRLVEMARSCDVVGIDAPFGWPAPFVAMLTGGASETWSTTWRDRLRFRRTDHHVHRETGRWPLSVSSDLIAVVAMRCHGLLAQLAAEGLRVHERVLEVYPAAALRRWFGKELTSYKGRDRREQLRALAAKVFGATPWLDCGSHQASLSVSDHALDACVAAMAVRAGAIGAVGEKDAIPTEPEVRREGWIVLPHADSLVRLADVGQHTVASRSPKH